jgi:signal transduction histidine kinase
MMMQNSLGQAEEVQPASLKLLRGWNYSLVMTIALAIAYFLAARLSLILLTEPDGVAVFWPAAGVSTGALIGLGSRARFPVITGTMAATVAANLMGDRNIGSAIIFALCNAGEAALVATLIGRYFGTSFNLDKPRNVFGLLTATIVGTAISGIGGTVGFELFHNSPVPTLTIWQHWFASDALGIIAVAPLLIGLTQAAREPPPVSEAVEGALALAILTFVSGLIVLLPRELWVAVVPTALLFPLLLWVTARCRPVFAATAAFVVALTVVSTTTFGIGILGDPNLPILQRVLCAQAGILTTSLCAFVLAALFAERRSNEAHLAHSNMMLERERDNKLLNAHALTAAIVHEVRQPLAAIAVYASAALRFLGKTPPDLAEVRLALNNMIKDTYRTSDVLEGFRALFEKSDQKTEQVRVNEIILGVLQSSRKELQDHRIETRLELASELPLVESHRRQLEEVIFNLVHNAIEAMDAAAVRDRVLWVRTELKGHDAITVAVRDSGLGIDPERLESIFGAFFTTKPHGMGLGLAICRLIIEHHGGQLTALSDGKNGSLFQFVLPIKFVQSHSLKGGSSE